MPRQFYPFVNAQKARGLVIEIAYRFRIDPAVSEGNVTARSSRGNAISRKSFAIPRKVMCMISTDGGLKFEASRACTACNGPHLTFDNAQICVLIDRLAGFSHLRRIIRWNVDQRRVSRGDRHLELQRLILSPPVAGDRSQSRQIARLSPGDIADNRRADDDLLRRGFGKVNSNPRQIFIEPDLGMA